MIKPSLCLLLILICGSAAAQLKRPFRDDIGFVQYLNGREQYRDGLLALKEMPLSLLTPAQKDTVNYLKGWNFYNIKELDSSTHYFLKVGSRSDFYTKSRFFSAYNCIYGSRYDSAAGILGTIPMTAPAKEVVCFEKAGIALLQGSYQEFGSLQKHFSYTLYALTTQEKNFSEYKEELMGLKRKSPVVAGLLSAIIPGTGKIYAGKTYQGIASMLPLAALALLTNESYHKRGPRSAEFYLFGSMLTVFYVGNIWGSVFAVKINRDDQEKLIHQKVLLDLQIPLRTLFD